MPARKPPQSAEELLERYAAGERDFGGALLDHGSLKGARLDGAFLAGSSMKYADLRAAHLSTTDLSAANLLGADLSGAILTQANLDSARLCDSSLRRAAMGRVACRNANLGSADLSGAELTRAVLNGAVLRGAVLRDVTAERMSLIKTSLADADLTGATVGRSNCGATIFGNTCLVDVSGLETINHLGPSVLDFRTLDRSGPLPTEFLQGVGLSDAAIAYAASTVASPIEFYSCFISHSHADKGVATRLHEVLQAQGVRCWLDEHQLLPGDDVHDAIDRGIKLWDKVILICSEASLTSWWVDAEIERAFQKEAALWKERGEKVFSLIPVDLDGYLLDGWASGKALRVRGRFAADFKDPSRFDEQVERVIKALRADGGGREPAPPSRL